MDVMTSIAEKAKLVNVDLTAEQVEAFEIYLRELAAFNEHTNLVSKADAEIVIDNHIMDSLTLVPVIQRLCEGRESGLIDIGSGAGFPGLILAVACPYLKVTLVESIGKKCNFLQACAESMSVDSRVQVFSERAEELAHGRDFRESFEFATARAVGNVEMISEFCVPFLRSGGYLLAQKSRAQLAEVDPARAALQILGGNVEEIIDIVNPATEKDFTLVLIKKVKATPAKYPRSFGQIKKSGIK
ncbi:MAG: 16S rRNA (guanine(527)-N(7))-methyltransferase RsmG [Candidatus Obscuribacterales bacterium]|nr:16S rRNA (guanine(527)-N(7))-methyltransferase RsmG [Candidatus Obscuribacterales bacterium]